LRELATLLVHTTGETWNKVLYQYTMFVIGIYYLTTLPTIIQGRIQDFKLGGGAHLKKLRWAEGGAKIIGVFSVKNHDFTPKNHIFSNFRGGALRLHPPPPPPLPTESAPVIWFGLVYGV
jgi:hypothetical protein